MLQDKKSQHGQLRLILPTSIGRVELVGGVETEEIRAAIEACQ
jgi:3-dehydroquinate synthetase